MRISDFLNPSTKQGQRILLSLVVLLFIICIKVLTIDYNENDDYIYSRIMSGAYSGTPSALTVYEGYLFSLFVSSLYRWFPNTIEWYIFVFHILYLSSFVVIFRKILHSNTSHFVKYITLVVGACAQLYLLISPQFTILAGELALAATANLIGKPSKKEYVIAILFIFLSSQLRIQALFMVFAVMIPLLFFPIQLKKKAYWTKPMMALVAIVVTIGINNISNKVYYQDEAWTYYSDYNKPRGVIEQNLCKMQAMDIISDSIKKTEYKNLCISGLIDGKILSIEEMNECAEYLQYSPLLFFKMNVLPYFYGLNAHCFYLVFIWLSGLLVYALRKRNWTTVAIIVSTAIIFLLELLYCMVTSWAKERVIICFMICLFAVATVCTYKLLKGKTSKICILIIALVVSCTYLVKSYKWEKEIKERLASTECINHLLASLPYEKVHCVGILGYSEAYHVHTTPFTNKVLGKGWLNNSPLHAAFYNGYESLLDRVPIVLTSEYLQNIKDIEVALQQRGILCTCNYLYKDKDFIVVLLKRVRK